MFFVPSYFSSCKSITAFVSVQHHPSRRAVTEGAGGAADHCGADVPAVQTAGAARHDRVHPAYYEHYHPAAPAAHYVSFCLPGREKNVCTDLY